VRWLLIKDLQILRRSPFLVVLLIAYPVIISVLIGLALSKGPDKPQVAFVNEVQAGDSEFSIGGETRDVTSYATELFKSIDPVRVKTRAEAVEKVRSGEVLGAMIIPRDAAEKLRNALSLSGSAELPTIEVIYNQEDPIKAEFVESTIKARLADANKALADEITKVGGGYLDILLKGGSFRILGRGFDVLGLQRTKQVLEGVRAGLPPNDPGRPALDQVIRFAGLAIDNLDLSDEILGAIGEPVKVKRTVLDGASTPLDRFAIAVAVTISLMFVTVLLAAGMLALEREEHAFGRLVRGLVSRTALVAEKIVLAAGCALAVTLLMLGGLSLFVALDGSRAPLWVPALAAGALAFGAMGVALGALAREVRAASLLAFLMSLPIAFLALVPSGAVSTGLFDVIRVVSAIFPFKPALHGVDAAVNDADGLGTALAHLAALTVAYATIARLALRRFG
jgi:ABC-2 type transport system permease protein